LLNYVFAVIVRQSAKNHMAKTDDARAESSSIQKAVNLYSETASTILEVLKLDRRITNAALRRLTDQVLPLLTEVFDPNFNKRKTTLGQLQSRGI